MDTQTGLSQVGDKNEFSNENPSDADPLMPQLDHSGEDILEQPSEELDDSPNGNASPFIGVVGEMPAILISPRNEVQTESDDESDAEAPSKKFKSEDLLENYGSLLSGQPRFRKICEDQEIYEIEGINMDLGTLNSLQQRQSPNEVCVEPTIKFEHEYPDHDESSTAAANLAMQMKIDMNEDDSRGSSYLPTLQYADNNTIDADINILRSVAEKLGESENVIVPSPESSYGTISPEQDTPSPTFSSSVSKITSNLDFPWTPLFQYKGDGTTDVGNEQNCEKSTGKVRFLDDTKECSSFVVPATPGHTPFPHLSNQKVPYRVTPHPSAGRTISSGESPCLKEDRPSDLSSSSTPQQAVKKFAFTPSSTCSNITLNSSGSEEEKSPNDCPPPRPPFNTPVEGSCSSPNVLSAKQLQALWKQSALEDRLYEDEGSATNRFQHNQKERVRRQRIKTSCDRLRTLIPGMTEKTDKATVFEFAAHYIAYLRSLLDYDYTPEYDKDFLKKATRLIAEEPF